VRPDELIFEVSTDKVDSEVRPPVVATWSRSWCRKARPSPWHRAEEAPPRRRWRCSGACAAARRGGGSLRRKLCQRLRRRGARGGSSAAGPSAGAAGGAPAVDKPNAWRFCRKVA